MSKAHAEVMDDRIRSVIARSACSGCGACTLLDRGLVMRIDADGFTRPMRASGSTASPDSAIVFDRVCPGMRVKAAPRNGRSVHPTMGPYVEAWQAWATDPEIRFRGSSGGALTALSDWLLRSGQAHRVTGAAADRDDPRRSVPVSIVSREEALAAAGSRYAPVATAGNPDIEASGTAVVGKPCEVAALRSLRDEGRLDSDPLLLSFYCAGTPSSHATADLTQSLGVPAGTVPEELWYRGRGWPGNFTVRSGDRVESISYDASWGEVLGPATQWRCKVCVDGVGDSADIVAADFWRSDEHGYPIFEDEDGMSALISRTARGREVVRAAAEAGVITLLPLHMDDLAGVQPLQVQRRRFLLGRLIGSALGGRRPPRYPGYTGALLRSALRHPRLTLRVLRGTRRRVIDS